MHVLVVFFFNQFFLLLLFLRHSYCILCKYLLTVGDFIVSEND